MDANEIQRTFGYTWSEAYTQRVQKTPLLEGYEIVEVGNVVSPGGLYLGKRLVWVSDRVSCIN